MGDAVSVSRQGPRLPSARDLPLEACPDRGRQIARISHPEAFCTEGIGDPVKPNLASLACQGATVPSFWLGCLNDFWGISAKAARPNPHR